MNDLGIKDAQYSIDDLLSDSMDGLKQKLNIRLVERNRQQDSKTLKRGYKMTEDRYDEDLNSKRVYVGPENGFETVAPEESVIFYSRDSDGASQHIGLRVTNCTGAGNIKIELAVIRNVARKRNSNLCDLFYDWLIEVIAFACNVRRDVRASISPFTVKLPVHISYQPPHPGKMTQTGLNSGPRHARISGWAVSFVKRLLLYEKVAHDEDVIAAVTLTWALALRAFPKEITDNIKSRLEDEKLPRIATRNVSEGSLMIRSPRIRTSSDFL